MIELRYLPKPKGSVFRKAYSMHLAGLENMVNDAIIFHQREQCHYWKILKVEVATGAVVATLASAHSGKPTNYSPIYREHVDAYRTDLTPSGEQTVIPECEIGAAPSATQLNLF